MNLAEQLITLFVLAIPTACISWTVTHEEVFREFREWCDDRKHRCGNLFQRKFFYLFGCEYCFSHYASALLVAITGYKLLFPGWQGYIISWLSLVWIANVYMTLYSRMRIDIKKDRVAIDDKVRQLAKTR